MPERWRGAMRRPDTAARKRAESRGRRAETLAVWYLRLKGYRILARRAKTPHGEIDIIARQGDSLIFVEVKARATLDMGVAALHPSARRRIDAAARLLGPRFGVGCRTTRVDAVIVQPWRWPVHLVAVWREGLRWN